MFILITFYSLIIPLHSFLYFKAYNLISSDKIILITNEGIYAFDSQSNELTELLQSSLIGGEEDLKSISFAQSPLENGGFFYCRLKKNIYIYDESFTSFGSFNIDAEGFCVLNPYKTRLGINILIVPCVKSDSNNSNAKLKIVMYTINYDNDENLIVSSIETGSISMKNLKGEEKNVYNEVLSCQLMTLSSYTNKLLTCFSADQENRVMNAVTFDPEKNLELVHYSSDKIQATDPVLIESALNPNGKECIVCVLEIDKNLNCLTYNSEKNEFTDFVTLFPDCKPYSINMDINYMSEKREYSVFCSSGNYLGMDFMVLDKNYNIKSKNSNNNECYYSFSVSSNNVYSIETYSIIYDKNSDSYKVLRAYNNNDGNSDAFDLINISGDCNGEATTGGLKTDIGETSEESSTTTPKTPTTSTSFQKADTTIPTTLFSPTTILKQATTIPTTSISPTTIVKEATTIPTTSISKSTLLKEATTIPTTSISQTTILKEATTIPTTSISTTTILKEATTIPTTSISKSTILKEATTIPTTSISKSTLIKEATTISTTSISTTTILKENTTIPTTIISPTTILKEATTIPTTSISKSTILKEA
ncbi:MAG: hypothetical protein IKN65_09455, partial [Clostridia bacterium]|nr:hypothetical protein [Clostridia bacterium]